MRKILIVGNWKMHLNIAQSSLLVHHLSKRIRKKDDVEVVICPSFIALQPLAKQLDHTKFTLGAQDLHYVDQGSHTGLVSAWQLKHLVHYAIIGHSEQRKYTDEDDEVIARKVAAAIRNDITPILCVGEKLMQRQNQETNAVIHDQLVAGLAMITGSDMIKLVVAYEPVWAIGTGDFAKSAQIKEVVVSIRHTIKELYGKTVSDKVLILYGGSVVPDFVRDYLKTQGVDGLLVGGASLNDEQFAAIVKSAQSIRRKQITIK